MAQTTLLPPFTAVRLAWALTGKFSKEPGSQDIAALAEKVLKDIQEQAQKTGGAEQQYVSGAVSTIQASLRSLDTIYKSRELNFEENEKLRSVYLDAIKENLQFGKKAQDLLKSLPTMTIAAGAGVVTVAQLFRLAGWQLWLVGLGLAGLGYLINQGIVSAMRKRQQQLYLEQDYERDLYYEHYVTRVRTTLVSLYLDLDRIHLNAFNQTYPVSPPETVLNIVEEIVKGIRPAMCAYVHKHRSENRITPELWPRCETGGTAAQYCRFWEGAPPA